MKLHELLRHVADNVEAGRNTGHGLLYSGVSHSVDHPDAIAWRCSQYYALAPKTHTVNGFEVPAPETDPPRHTQDYYYVDPAEKEYHGSTCWINDRFDKARLARGLVFLDPEAARANGLALFGIDPYAETEK
jgi:hypothetical protein